MSEEPLPADATLKHVAATSPDPVGLVRGVLSAAHAAKAGRAERAVDVRIGRRGTGKVPYYRTEATGGGIPDKVRVYRSQGHGEVLGLRIEKRNWSTAAMSLDDVAALMRSLAA